MVNLRYQDGSDRPATSGIFIADVLGGTHAFGAIQAALYQRERTGQGQHIDLSMLEAMVGMLVFETQEAQFPGDARRPLYTPLKTNDGFIMVARPVRAISSNCRTRSAIPNGATIRAS